MVCKDDFVRHEAQMILHNKLKGIVPYDVLRREAAYEIYQKNEGMVNLGIVIAGEGLVDQSLFHLILVGIRNVMESCNEYLIDLRHCRFSLEHSYISEEGVCFEHIPSTVRRSNFLPSFFQELQPLLNSQDSNIMERSHTIGRLLSKDPIDYSLLLEQLPKE